MDSVEVSGRGQPVRELRWSRTLRFTDSGSYMCMAVNDNGTSIAELDVLVRRKSIILSRVGSASNDGWNIIVPDCDIVFLLLAYTMVCTMCFDLLELIDTSSKISYFETERYNP